MTKDGLKFIADENSAKAGKWLRTLGYDTVLYKGGGDDAMIKLALDQGRVLITRDTAIMKRRIVSSGKVRAILLGSQDPLFQVQEIVDTLELGTGSAFSLCLECNDRLIKKPKEEAKELVPEYVFETNQDYSQCPGCGRIYWKGTHWESMSRKLSKISAGG